MHRNLKRLGRAYDGPRIAARPCRGVWRAGNLVTAIDIALEPDATMAQHAEAANARLLKVFPKGFALDARRIIHTSRSCSRTSARRTSIETALRGPGRREGRQLETEGVQVLLIPWKGALELGSAFEEVLKF